MSSSKKLLQAAAGAAGGGGIDVEDVFNTDIYTGTGSTKTITNGIDLSGEGGMIWWQTRFGSYINDPQLITDSEMGVGKWISPTNKNGSGGSVGDTQYFSSFNSDGFTLGYDNAMINTSSEQLIHTFRKCEKFFTIVKYTGDGTSSRTISHDLGSTPAFILIKNLDASFEWPVYHRYQGTGGRGSIFNYGYQFYTTTYFNGFFDGTDPTSTEFTLGYDTGPVNQSGNEYVAYLFAHNDGDGEFGPNADMDIIKCGHYTGNGFTGFNGPFVDLGFEPQWLMIKNASRDNAPYTDYHIFNDMSTAPVGKGNSTPSGYSPWNYGNKTGQEQTDGLVNFMPTGFQLTQSGFNVNYSGDEYVYVAIRKGTKVPSSVSECFEHNLRNTVTDYSVGFEPDTYLTRRTDSGNEWYLLNKTVGFYDRMNNSSYYSRYVTPSNTSNSGQSYDVAMEQGNILNSQNNLFDGGYEREDYFFKRAPEVYDVIAWEGNTTSRDLAHNLTVTPEMIWCINYSASGNNWAIWHKDLVLGGGVNSFLAFNTTDPESTNTNLWNQSSISDTTFNVGTEFSTNYGGDMYAAHLFASKAGISKVGSYTGTGSNQTIDCGFSNGFGMLIIKNIDRASTSWRIFNDTGDYYMGFDTNGQAFGDLTDQHSSGFTVKGSDDTVNRSGDPYVFIAFAKP